MVIFDALGMNGGVLSNQWPYSPPFGTGTIGQIPRVVFGGTCTIIRVDLLNTTNVKTNFKLNCVSSVSLLCVVEPASIPGARVVNVGIIRRGRRIRFGRMACSTMREIAIKRTATDVFLLDGRTIDFFCHKTTLYTNNIAQLNGPLHKIDTTTETD